MDYQQRNARHGNGGTQNRAGLNSSSTVRSPMNQSSNAATGAGPLMGNMNVQAELLFLKQEAAYSRNAIFSLEQEKDSLRKAIRKLKLENSRVRQKVKKLQENVNELRGCENDAGSDVAEQDYDEIGHNFLLVGGVQDPLSSSYDSKIKDEKNVEHKSAERLYMYMIADHFNDETAKKKILEASNSEAAENAVKGIQNYNEKIWSEHRVEAWKQAQKMKFDQHREILNLLVLSKGIYIGVASHDKFFGTGWRKNREESNKPVFWDGENEGGKILMRLREEYKEAHTFSDKDEEETAQKNFNHNRKFIWRRLDQARRLPTGMIGVPQPQIVRTGLANRRGFFANNRRPQNMGYGAPTYYSNMTGGFYNQQQPQQWSKKRPDGSGSSQYH